MIIYLTLLLLQALQAHPTAASPQTADECAVLALVAREHLGFAESVSPPLRASGNYRPDCPWEELGVKIGTVSANRQAKLVFSRPRIDGDKAVVESLAIHGTLAGAGWRCDLRNEGARWKLQSCLRTRAL